MATVDPIRYGILVQRDRRDVMPMLPCPAMWCTRRARSSHVWEEARGVRTFVESDNLISAHKLYGSSRQYWHRQVGIYLPACCYS